MNKTLFVVATPIGNLKDFSQRAIDTLNNCDLILCEDTRVSIKLLDSFGIKKPLQKYEKFSEKEVAQNAENLFLKFENIALITDAGTPCISDPGSILIKKVRELGYNIVGIPGCSAIIYALSVSGLENNNFCFLGFLPRENGAQKKLFESLKENSENINCFVFYESPNRIINSIKNLKNIDIENVFLVNDATKLFEKHYSGSLNEVIKQLEDNPKSNKGEYVAIFTIKNNKKESKNSLSLEALIVEEMTSKSISSKEAIKNLATKYARNELYAAGLNLKKIIQ